MKTKAKPHRWTFSEVSALFKGKSYIAFAGPGCHIRAFCLCDDPELQKSEAYFDIETNWDRTFGHIGRFDKVDATINDLIRKISAKFPTSTFWEYDSLNQIIIQAP